MNYPFMIAACIFIEGNHNTINSMLYIELRLIDSSLWSEWQGIGDMKFVVEVSAA